MVLHHSQRPVDVPVAVFRQLDDGEGRHHVSLDGIEVSIILPFYNDDRSSITQPSMVPLCLNDLRYLIEKVPNLIQKFVVVFLTKGCI